MNLEIRADFYRLTGVPMRLGNSIRMLIKNPCFRFLFCYRILKNSRNIVVRLLFKIPFNYFSTVYGIQIPTSVEIGSGLLLPHYGGIVINSKAKIGKNCTILHNSTIGNDKGKRKGSPKINDNVYIGPGAVLVGNIEIGENSLIAPNSFVNVDIPPNSVVIGNPSIIKSRAQASNAYIQNPLL